MTILHRKTAAAGRSSIYDRANFQFVISMEWLLIRITGKRRLEEASWGHLALPLAQHESSFIWLLSSSEPLGSVIHSTVIAILEGSERALRSKIIGILLGGI